jgi:hypothetical protein
VAVAVAVLELLFFKEAQEAPKDAAAVEETLMTVVLVVLAALVRPLDVAQVRQETVRTLLQQEVAEL